MIIAILTLLFSINIHAESKLLDKVAGVINDKIFTLSEVNRVKKTLPFRSEIAPFIYNKKSYSENELLLLLQHNFIIKDKLAELGYVISDDSVESRIIETEKSSGLNRTELHAYLKTKGISYDEYYELIREAMEFNIFNSRIIAPLVSLTDQELKNYYIAKFSQGKALTFKYSLVDFTIDASKVDVNDYRKFQESLTVYRKTGNLPSEYSDLTTNDLGSMTDEDLPKNIKETLKTSEQGKFSKPLLIDNTLHTFFITKKEIVDSEDFLSKKNYIYNQLFMERSGDILNTWFSKESLSYYLISNL